jgi:hypothetical protein
VDGSASIILGEDAYSQLSGADWEPPDPQWAWTPDSNTFLFIQINPVDKDLFDVVSYDLTDRQKSVQVSFPKLDVDVVNISPSPDGKSLLISSRSSVFSYYSFTLKSRLLWKAKYHPANMLDGSDSWSSNNAYLAIFISRQLTIYNSDGRKQ